VEESDMESMTKHAVKRCQQRGVPRLIVEWLFQFGEFKYSSGAEIGVFTKKSQKAIRNYAGAKALSSFGGYMDSYLVYKDGRILTVGRRYRNVRLN
jgi:hypothetical protein